MTEGKREKCQVCANCDLDGHCLAKENYDYFECENDEYFEPIEEETKCKKATMLRSAKNDRTN